MFFKQKASEKNHKNKKRNDSTKSDSKKKGKEQKIKPVPDLICKSYVEGCLTLGCIHAINNGELIVSLPGMGNFGHVRLNNISEIYTDLIKKSEPVSTLTEMYSKGELVRCKVLNYANKKLNLTIEPNQVNSSLNIKSLQEEMVISGCVKTREDHGYTIDMGIEGIQGFYKTDEQKLSVGQCSLFKIRNMQSERMVNLSLCDSTKESMFYALKTKNQFDSYLPGALVNDIVVEKVCKNGVQLNIPSSQMIGYVQQNHMSNKKFSNGDKLNATIIFINPYARVVYLSMLPHLLNSTKPSKLSKLFASNQESLKVGQQIESAEVTTHTPKGVYVQFKLGPNSSQAITGFIPKRHLFELDDEENEDEQEEVDGVKVKKTKNDLKNMTREDIEKSYPLKSSLRARIYDFNLIEDLILLSCRKNILDAAFMGYDELKLGQVVKCKVKRLNPDNGGIVVSLSEFVSGFIPKIHTSDVPLSENLLNRKIKKDKELKCKIIQLDPVEKRCVLTAKQTLIKSKLTLIDSFDMLHVGLETYGFVVSIQKYGLLLGFLNEMKGLLPRQEISASLENRDLKDLYYLGQIIKCRVIDFNKEKQQIKLSLLMKQKDLTSESITSDTENQVEKIDVEFKVGDIVSSATILNVNDEKGCLTLKMPHGLKNGIIYKNQLSDLDALNELLFDYYKNNPSKQMSNLMIIQANNKSYYLTLKTTLIEYYKDQSHMIAKSFAELNTNQEHRGWIKKILENALLIELPNNLVGFCSHKSIKYLNQMKQCAGLNQGQSVIVRINKLIADKNQFITNVLTRHDLTQRNAQESSFLIDLFKSYLANTHRLFDFYSKHNKLKTGINPSVFNSIQLIQRASGLFKIGSIVQVAVKSHNRQTGLIECLFLDELKENDKDNLQNLIGYAYETEKAYEEGTKLSAMILAFDPLAKVFCLNVDKKKVKIYSKNFDASLTQTANCKVDQCVKAEILYVSNWFCIVGLKAHALGSLAFMPLFRNDFTQIHTFSSFNQQKATTSGNDLSSLSPNARQSLDLIDSKIKQQQVVAVSSAIVSSLGQNEPAKGKKGDKRFNYFKYGQKLRVTIKQNKSDELNYLIVVSEPKSLKQNKKMLLKHLSILNENNSETSRKRQLSDSDEPILVKKKLVLSERKRKLSEQNNDFIEIVTDVRKSEPKKSKVDETVSEQDVNLSEVFPWEVTDFDQFNAIINKTFETNESKSSTSKKNSNTATPAKPSKADLSLSNQLKAYENEERIYDPNREPENSDDYERLIATNPNNSLNWIKYIVFYLQMAEIDKARGVAEQALKTILYNRDQDRLNVWVAWLNLENMYGTQASIEDIFNRANQNCDSFKVHKHLAEIYARSNKLQEAELVFMKMTKKFSASPDVWTSYGIFHYKNSNTELARKLLIRSLGSLDKKDHVEMVNKYAQLEFKYGDIERGKTMYDSLLFTYPNRTDIWSVYTDMLVKHQKYDDARQVFNRIAQLGLTAKRMKFIFKKFIDFEKAHGTEETIDAVKMMTLKYVEKNQQNETHHSESSHKNGSHSIEENLKKSLKV